jgi:pimeloyl-ACP methyl ester carboxylesterase
MDLTGAPLVVVLALLFVAAPAALLLLWSRLRGPSALRIAQRVGLVLVCQLSAVLLAAVVVNDQFELYSSWSDLTGGGDDGAAGAGVTHAAGGAASPTHVHKEGGPIGSGTQVLSEEVTGPRSGVHARVWVVLPPGYTAAANSTRSYPLVEFLPGYPGVPNTWLHAMHLADQIDRLVSSGAVKPFVAVLPVMTVEPPLDTECTNVPGGPAVGTWLAQDVPDVVRHQLRVRPAAEGWGVIGYSTGGFCATKLALQYPQVFHAAASLSGYYTPATDPSTGGIFRRNDLLRRVNSPIWLAGNGHQPAVDILAVSSPQDPSSWPATRAFVAAVRRPVSLDTLVLPGGGHNTGVWTAVLPQTLGWLLQHVDRPVHHRAVLALRPTS